MIIKNMVLIGFMLLGGICHGFTCKCQITDWNPVIPTKTCTGDTDCAGLCKPYTHRCTQLHERSWGSVLPNDITSTDGICTPDTHVCHCPVKQRIKSCGKLDGNRDIT